MPPQPPAPASWRSTASACRRRKSEKGWAAVVPQRQVAGEQARRNNESATRAAIPIPDLSTMARSASGNRHEYGSGMKTAASMSRPPSPRRHRGRCVRSGQDHAIGRHDGAATTGCVAKRLMICPRSSSRRTIAARNSGLPAPERERGHQNFRDGKAEGLVGPSADGVSAIVP